MGHTKKTFLKKKLITSFYKCEKKLFIFIPKIKFFWLSELAKRKANGYHYKQSLADTKTGKTRNSRDA